MILVGGDAKYSELLECVHRVIFFILFYDRLSGLTKLFKY